MSFTIILKQRRGWFQKAVDLNLEKILQDMNLKYGSYNEGYVLQPEEASGRTFIFYHPERLGRGIFFDASKIGKDGEVLLRHLLPTTPSEIKDFFTIIRAIREQYGSVEYIIDKESVKEEEVWCLEQELMATSLQELHTFFQNNKDTYPIQTLAMFPYTFSKQQREEFAQASDLLAYEALLHEVQDIDAYYAKPNIYENKDSGDILAIYTLTDDTESIFPLDGETVLLVGKEKFDKVYIQFVLYSKQQLLDGFYEYDKFIHYIMTHRELAYFDVTHVVIPPLTEDEIKAIIAEIS